MVLVTIMVGPPRLWSQARGCGGVRVRATAGRWRPEQAGRRRGGGWAQGRGGARLLWRARSRGHWAAACLGPAVAGPPGEGAAAYGLFGPWHSPTLQTGRLRRGRRSNPGSCSCWGAEGSRGGDPFPPSPLRSRPGCRPTALPPDPGAPLQRLPPPAAPFPSISLPGAQSTPRPPPPLPSVPVFPGAPSTLPARRGPRGPPPSCPAPPRGPRAPPPRLPAVQPPHGPLPGGRRRSPPQADDSPRERQVSDRAPPPALRRPAPGRAAARFCVRVGAAGGQGHLCAPHPGPHASGMPMRPLPSPRSDLGGGGLPPA